MEENRSPWQEYKKLGKYAVLSDDIRVDVGIVGGGLAGIACAYYLSKAGKKVAVFEKNSLGSGATSLTTAFLTEEIDTDLSELEKTFDAETARLVWQSGQAAIGAIDNIAREEGISCEFVRCPGKIYANNPKEFESLEKDQRTAEKLGLQTLLKDGEELPFKNNGYLEIPNQAKFHPLKFLYGLADKAAMKGAMIFENTEILEASGKKNSFLLSASGAAHCDQIVVATYKPFNNPVEVFAKKGMYKTYLLEAEIPPGALPEGIFWDDQNPYHYFRVDKCGQKDRLIIGGEDHREFMKMDEEKNFKALEDYLREIFGSLEAKIVRRWTGPILEPSDGLALIGETKPHQYVATAFSGNGMTYSMISGMLIADLILGRTNPLAKVYDPKRLKLSPLLSKAGDYLEEFVDGAVKNAFKKKKE